MNRSNLDENWRRGRLNFNDYNCSDDEPFKMNPILKVLQLKIITFVPKWFKKSDIIEMANYFKIIFSKSKLSNWPCCKYIQDQFT